MAVLGHTQESYVYQVQDLLFMDLHRKVYDIVLGLGPPAWG